MRDDVRERIAARKASQQSVAAHAPQSPQAARAAQPPRSFQAPRAPRIASDEFDGQREDLPVFDLGSCDQEKLFAVIHEAVTRLVTPIVGEMTCTLAIAGSRVKVTIDCGESSGLLVGREGQTLAAIQYITGRIIAKILGGTVRLQFDAGNYRERQDDRLRELALALAAKVKEAKRSFSTKPLSAYQRRIVHLALEQDTEVQTFSKGEGVQRRVVVQLRRGDAGKSANTDDGLDASDVEVFTEFDSDVTSGFQGDDVS